MNTTTQLSDSALVSLYIAGNENAFEQLVNRHKNKVFTTILLIVKDTYTAEDLMQDAFIKAIHTMKGGRYNEEGKFSSWICRIAHNLAIDFFRKEKRSPMITLEDGSNVFNALSFAEDSAESQQIKEDTHARLRELIQTLPQAQREVLMMRHYADMSFQEIAEATGVSINTALGRMRYALINLRKKMLNSTIAYDKNLYSE
ncbi:sigma-70 family RNA polymerase sigma factor [Pontibacter sp. HSC-14F20]|uniref:RNA polymerase, sigma subunit, ECF family n=3 Tax=Pontibacter TaxID=323449 RepID=A0A1N7BCG0_9BACT|nr:MULTISPECIES: sigma-70 family RNA polymerase sigma factor [Pontibacter]EJF10290.1 ECF subfamily RNA polymerase sigma-24 subunit [Pontibacter sp. BAB1700]MBF8965329.1 sigma-70 family RNA polymerase sigma factor [Pontibacter sp. FD36]MBX0334075.1 sigma-70 family RNA polymerase sigma factor [Pontibacter sp. HSC-14F20]MCP2045615.1 RNA polymerase sigma-70 factor (ECF subfamily) [Pontibacter sp. HSC-36F09]PVY39238.1 RNA polymerase ECF family sigma subunit [Pontibacter virosus]